MQYVNEELRCVVESFKINDVSKYRSDGRSVCLDSCAATDLTMPLRNQRHTDVLVRQKICYLNANDDFQKTWAKEMRAKLKFLSAC